MSNKKRINDRMVMLQKRSAKIEKARRDILTKILLRIGMNSTEWSKALLRFSNACSQASQSMEKLQGVFECGTEQIVMNDGSKKQVFVMGSNHKNSFLNSSRVRQIENKHKSYLDVMGIIPALPNVIFDEITELNQTKLVNAMSITGNLHKASSSIMDAMILYNKSPR